MLSDEVLQMMMFIILPIAAVIILWRRNLPAENRDDGTLNLKKALLALGIGFFTSAVNVFFKDMAQIVSICLQFGIWMTPIMYHEAMFTGAGKWVEVLFKLNPFYYVVAGYRDTMLTGNWFWERPTLTLYYWGFTAVVLLLGLKMFKRLRPHFSDVL